MAGCEDIPAPELSNMVLATEDAVIAAHTACIAAESLGIGSCYIGDIVENFEIHKELLNLSLIHISSAFLTSPFSIS